MRDFLDEHFRGRGFSSETEDLDIETTDLMEATFPALPLGGDLAAFSQKFEICSLQKCGEEFVIYKEDPQFKWKIVVVFSMISNHGLN